MLLPYTDNSKDGIEAYNVINHSSILFKKVTLNMKVTTALQHFIWFYGNFTSCIFQDSDPDLSHQTWRFEVPQFAPGFLHGHLHRYLWADDLWNTWAAQPPKEAYPSPPTVNTQAGYWLGSFTCIPKVRWDESEPLRIFKVINIFQVEMSFKLVVKVKKMEFF